MPVEQKDMAVPSVPDIKSYKVKCRFIFHFKAKMWLVSFFDIKVKRGCDTILQV